MTETIVRERRRTVWPDNIKTWKGLSLVETVRATVDRSQSRKIVHDVAKSRATEESQRIEIKHRLIPHRFVAKVLLNGRT